MAQQPDGRRTRMTSAERREQLIEIARDLFSERGFDGTSVEEIAARAKVSKPIIYEHFGGKEGLYAVVVDREVNRLSTRIQTALAPTGDGYRAVIERGALALLDYIDECPAGFRIISRDSTVATSSGSFASILTDIAASVEALLRAPLKAHGYSASLARPLSHGLVGLVAMAGQDWVDTKRPNKQQLAAELVNLAWNGLANLEHKPVLRSASAKKATDKTARY